MGPNPIIDLGGAEAGSATPLVFEGNAATIEDWIGLNGDVRDYYAFRQSEAGPLEIVLDRLSDNVNLQLFRASGERIAASYRGGINRDVITGDFGVGDYYVSLFGKTREVQSSYRLSISVPDGAVDTDAVPTVTPAPPVPPEAPAEPVAPPVPTAEVTIPDAAIDLGGDSPASAVALAWQGGSAQVGDWIGVGGDRKDYYAFTTDQAGEVTLTLSGLSDNAQLQLSDAAGKRIKASYSGGTNDEVISQTLEAGTYYASIFGKSTAVETAYQLKIDAAGAADTAADTVVPGPLPEPEPGPDPAPLPTPAPLPDPPVTVDLAGDSPATALALTFEDGVATIQEQIGVEGDRKDYHAFTLNQAGAVTLTLSGLSDNAQLQLSDATGKRIQASYRGGINDEVITQTLAAGTYYASIFGKTTAVETGYQLTVAAPESAGDSSVVDSTPIEPEAPPQPGSPAPQPEAEPIVDWFSNSLQDSELTQLARDRFADGKIDRLDMISLLQSAGDGGLVDSQEFTDLQLLVGSAEQLNLDDDVVNLADKVVNGDRANQWYTGGAQQRQDLGNLQAGSSSGQLDQLVGKWFLGSDRPSTLSTAHQYQYIEGSLFQDGLAVTDISQVQLGNCYLMAVLASAAHENPSAIEEMIRDNGDGTFTVRFFRNGNAEYVTVDRYLPVLSGSGESPYAQFGDSPGSDRNELWAALIEKAYAQVNESGWIAQDLTNRYGGIEGGWMSGPVREILGTSSQTRSISRMSQLEVVDWVASDRLLTVGIVGAGEHGVIDNHAYAVTDYDADAGTFHLENPWGVQHVDLTWAELETMNVYFIGSV